MAPQAGFGTTFEWNAKEIAKLTNIGGIELSVDSIDVTTHQSADNYKESLPGMIDAGEVSIEGLLDTTDADGQIAMIADLNGRTTRAAVITFPSGANWSFNAYLTKLKIGDAPIDGAIPFSASVKVTGKPTFAATAV